jgi:hypothetical protein
MAGIISYETGDIVEMKKKTPMWQQRMGNSQGWCRH